MCSGCLKGVQELDAREAQRSRWRGKGNRSARASLMWRGGPHRSQ
jgi:hypothetical protein